VHDLPAPAAQDVFERSEDPKGWDRASIRFRSHPLHPFPKVTQADFILPPAGDRLRLLGDAAIFGACVALLCFFPLWVANVLAVGALGNWVWGAMGVCGVLGAVFLFFASGRAEREFQKFLASL
jgi:hypothetical protein